MVLEMHWPVDSLALSVVSDSTVSRGMGGVNTQQAFRGDHNQRRYCGGMLLIRAIALTFALAAALAVPLYGREKDALQYGEGLIVNISLPVAEVTQAVEEVSGNGIIRGTKEYNKDEHVSGAEAAAATPVFPKWTDAGKVFYKVRKQALDPRNFKDSGDVGTAGFHPERSARKTAKAAV